MDAMKRSNSTKQWVKVQVIAEEPDPNPVLSAVVRRTGISI